MKQSSIQRRPFLYLYWFSSSVIYKFTELIAVTNVFFFAKLDIILSVCIPVVMVTLKPWPPHRPKTVSTKYHPNGTTIIFHSCQFVCIQYSRWIIILPDGILHYLCNHLPMQTINMFQMDLKNPIRLSSSAISSIIICHINLKFMNFHVQHNKNLNISWKEIYSSQILIQLVAIPFDLDFPYLFLKTRG